MGGSNFKLGTCMPTWQPLTPPFCFWFSVTGMPPFSSHCMVAKVVYDYELICDKLCTYVSNMHMVAKQDKDTAENITANFCDRKTFVIITYNKRRERTGESRRDWLQETLVFRKETQN